MTVGPRKVSDYYNKGNLAYLKLSISLDKVCNAGRLYKVYRYLCH